MRRNSEHPTKGWEHTPYPTIIPVIVRVVLRTMIGWRGYAPTKAVWSEGALPSRARRLMTGLMAWAWPFGQEPIGTTCTNSPVEAS